MRLNYFLLPVLMASLAIPAQARWFEVEVLIFSRNQDPKELDEDFSQIRFKPMPIQTLDLIAPLLLAPTDCPDPEPVKPLDETGTPVIQLTASTEQAVTQKSQNTTRPSHADQNLIEANVIYDELGFPISRTPEQQIAYEQWLSECNKPKSYNEIEQLPVTMVLAELPENDNQAYLLTTEQLQLKEAFKRLTRNASYKALLHTGWRMDIQSKKDMPTIRLIAGQNFGQAYNSDGWAHIDENQTKALLNDSAVAQETMPPNLHLPLTEKATSEPNLVPSMPSINELPTNPSVILPIVDMPTIEPIPQPRPPVVWELQTDIRIWLASWLHIETQSTLRREGRKSPQDIVNNQALTQVGPTENSGSLVSDTATVPYLFSYNMEQFKRVRSEEIHYFDHPLMGIVIQIRAYTPRSSSDTIR